MQPSAHTAASDSARFRNCNSPQNDRGKNGASERIYEHAVDRVRIPKLSTPQRTHDGGYQNDHRTGAWPAQCPHPSGLLRRTACSDPSRNPTDEEYITVAQRRIVHPPCGAKIAGIDRHVPEGESKQQSNHRHSNYQAAKTNVRAQRQIDTKREENIELLLNGNAP